MGRKVSLYELKQQKNKGKNNLLGDGDYYLRDKEDEKELGYPNTFDMTPPETQESIDARIDKASDEMKIKYAAEAKIKAQAAEDAKLDIESKKKAQEQVQKMMDGKKAAAAKREAK